MNAYERQQQLKIVVTGATVVHAHLVVTQSRHSVARGKKLNVTLEICTQPDSLIWLSGTSSPRLFKKLPMIT